MITIILLFAAAAVLGLIVLVPVLKGSPHSRPAAIAHGLAAAVALVLLLVQYLNGATKHQLSVILFVVAALGGFVLFVRDLQKKSLPKGLALIHAGIAVAAFLLLIFAVL